MDLTKIDAPFGKLDRATQLALLGAFHLDGHVLQFKSGKGIWFDLNDEPHWDDVSTYRVSPMTADTIDWSHVDARFVRLERDKGQPACVVDASGPDEPRECVMANVYSSYRRGTAEECVVVRP